MDLTERSFEFEWMESDLSLVMRKCAATAELAIPALETHVRQVVEVERVFEENRSPQFIFSPGFLRDPVAKFRYSRVLFSLEKLGEMVLHDCEICSLLSVEQDLV